MKRLKHIEILLCLVLVLSLASCEREDIAITEELQNIHTLNVESLCEQSAAVKGQYEEDAIRLAIELEGRSVDEPTVYVEGRAYQQAMDALMAIYNAKELPARDSIFEMYDIHVRPDFDLRKITLGLDANYSWTRSWLSGEQMTGNSEVDEMIETYGLALSHHDANLTYVTLEAERPLNIEQLGRLFSTIEGVKYADQEWLFGGAEHIEMRSFADYLEVTFSVGYGDCQAGCVFRHFWEFHVFDNCEVKYVGSYGDQAP